MRLICSQALVQVQAALHHLDAQVVLLVDHQAELSRCGRWPRRGRPALSACSRLIRCRSTRNWRSTASQLVDVDVEQLVGVGDGQDRARAGCFSICGAVLRRGPADEGEVGQVAGQADAAADDDVGLGAGAAQPFAARSSQVVEFHGVPSSASRPRLPSCGSVDHDGLLALDAADFVAQFRGPLVVLLGDGLLHLAAEADQLGLAFGVALASAAAACPTCSVSPWMFMISGSSCLLEADVVVRAAQPALAAELVERDAADRAGLLVELGQLLGRLADGHLLGQRRRPCWARRPVRTRSAVRYCRACSSQRCNSCGLPPVSSVMWNVAGLSHCWHFIATLLPPHEPQPPHPTLSREGRRSNGRRKPRQQTNLRAIAASWQGPLGFYQYPPRCQSRSARTARRKPTAAKRMRATASHFSGGRSDADNRRGTAARGPSTRVAHPLYLAVDEKMDAAEKPREGGRRLSRLMA